jgi:drug/metabolite transporter (DMT)-like permease
MDYIAAVMQPIGPYTEPGIIAAMVTFKAGVWIGILLLGILQYFLAMILFLAVLARFDETRVVLSNYPITFLGNTAAIVLHETLTTFMSLKGNDSACEHSLCHSP